MFFVPSRVQFLFLATEAKTVRKEAKARNKKLKAHYR